MSDLGKYQLIRKLATGGMAELFLAKAAGPKGFEKTLVLKRILPQYAADESFVEMFLSEARIAAHLNHPNIVQIFDFGEVDGTYFLAMEFIDGPNLRTIRRRAYDSGTPIPFALCAKIISLVCEGLSYAHEFTHPETGQALRLIHRDLSPENVLVSLNGAVKVVDFGIAKAADSAQHTKPGVVKGKIWYMAPEQLEGKPTDARADIFALGIVFYELLTGSRPFEGTNELSMMRAILHDEFTPIFRKRHGVPQALEAIVARALAKNPADRFESCRMFQAELEKFIRDSGETVGPFHLTKFITELGVTPVPRTLDTSLSGPHALDAQDARTAATQSIPGRRLRWSRIQALLLTAACGLLAGALSWWLWFSDRTEPLPPPDPVVIPAPSVSPPPPEAAPPLPSDPEPTEARRPPKKRQRTATPEPVPPVRSYSVEFRIRPYATVFLNGENLGQTPILPVKLRAGKHAIRLVNAELGKDVSVDFNVSEESTVFRYNLSQ